MPPKEPHPRRDHQARVNVDDATWTEFRRFAAPLSHTLGEMVEREVRRYRQRQARGGTMDEQRLPEMLEEARELRDALVAVVERIERYEARRAASPPAPEQPTPGVWRW